jgi:hypothetical protein
VNLHSTLAEAISSALLNSRWICGSPLLILETGRALIEEPVTWPELLLPIKD